MTGLIVLDTGPLGIITNPRLTPEVVECTQWLRAVLMGGSRIAVPEIADYELRRELLRAGKLRGLRRLNMTVEALDYLPISTTAMRRAAEIWATLRRQGLPLADPRSLDGDVILAAQALVATQSGETMVIATTNVGHLSQIAPAERWQDIAP